jgi:hypothetical protein
MSRLASRRLYDYWGTDRSVKESTPVKWDRNIPAWLYDSRISKKKRVKVLLYYPFITFFLLEFLCLYHYIHASFLDRSVGQKIRHKDIKENTATAPAYYPLIWRASCLYNSSASSWAVIPSSWYRHNTALPYDQWLSCHIPEICMKSKDILQMINKS